MKFYGKAELAATKIMEAFEAGNLPKAIAPVFLPSDQFADLPCYQWSFNNRVIMRLFGHNDARGFQAWKKSKRSVKKGGKSFPILAPLTCKVESKNKAGETESKRIPYGFKSVNVFGYDQTEGEEIIYLGEDTQKFLDSLPLVDVAKSWDLSIGAFPGEGAGGCHGYYQPGHNISVGVKNLSTWCHELIHASDHKVMGTIKGGQQLDQEVVAMFGASVLLEMLGKPTEADHGGCWEYITHYSKKEDKNPAAVCLSLLSRTCKAVDLILRTSEQLNLVEA